MHLSIKDQTRDAKPAIMCIEKPIRVCIVLNASIEQATTFSTLAEALGVTEIMCIAPYDKLEEYYAEGWVPMQTRLLVAKTLKGTK